MYAVQSISVYLTRCTMKMFKISSIAMMPTETMGNLAGSNNSDFAYFTLTYSFWNDATRFCSDFLEVFAAGAIMFRIMLAKSKENVSTIHNAFYHVRIQNNKNLRENHRKCYKKCIFFFCSAPVRLDGFEIRTSRVLPQCLFLKKIETLKSATNMFIITCSATDYYVVLAVIRRTITY